MMNIITKRQKDLLCVLYNCIREGNGFSPTLSEMRERLRVASNQSVIDLIKKLERAELVERRDGAARSIRILPAGYKTLGLPPLIPLMGTTAAGLPLEMIETDSEWKTMPGNVSELKGNVFLLKISGDSMINAGINDGDVVLVKEDTDFHSGDIVLARIGDESTVKRFLKEGKKKPYLKPENPNYDIIPITEDVELKGKVVSVFSGGEWKKTGK